MNWTAPVTASRGAVAIAAVLLIGAGVVVGAAVNPRDPIVETETVEVPVTPRACMDAVEAARAVAGINSEFVDAVSAYPDLVADAAIAGYFKDDEEILRVTTDMEAVDATVDRLNGRLRPIVNGFTHAATACEASR